MWLINAYKLRELRCELRQSLISQSIYVNLLLFGTREIIDTWGWNNQLLSKVEIDAQFAKYVVISAL